MAGQLSFPALWHDTLTDTRALMPLALPVAAAFVLLPGVAIDLFGPPPPRTTAEMTPHVVLIELFLPALIALVAQGTVIRLCLDRRRGVSRSVGEALAASLRAWPLLVAAVCLCAVPIGFGMLALIVPGIYLAGRLTPAIPLVIDGRGPVAAVEASWALTHGNGWRTIGFVLLFSGWFIVISAAAAVIGSGAAAALTAAGAGGAGAAAASAIDGLVAALFAVVNAVAVATVYRQLTA
jgi:hypothetical protein